MHLLSLFVDAGHPPRELVIYDIINGDDAVIGVLSVEAALGRLIGVQEPMVTDESGLLQASADVTLKAPRALALAGNTRAGPDRVGQSGIIATEGELSDQAWPAATGIRLNGRSRIIIIAIKPDDIEVTSGGLDDGLLRHIGKSSAEHEMVRIGFPDCGNRDLEVTVGQRACERVAIGKETYTSRICG